MGQILDGMLHTLDEKSPIWRGSPGCRVLRGHASHLRRDKTIADSPCQTQAQHTHAHFLPGHRFAPRLRQGLPTGE